jgi:hypothetical protein
MPLATDTPKTYPTYTNMGLDQGVLDQLMTAVNHHIDQQWNSGRIDKATYGQVYLGALDAVLQQSTQYILGLLLLEEKRRGLDLQNQTAEYNLEVMLPKQVEKITAEISLLGKQEDKIDKEIEFLTAKIKTEKANTEDGIATTGSLIGKQITLLTAQRYGFAGDIQTKVGKLYSDFDAVYQSVQEPEAMTTLNPTYTQGKLDEAEAIAALIKALP